MEYILIVTAIIMVVFFVLYFKNRKESIVEKSKKTNTLSSKFIISDERPFNEKMDIILGEITRNDFDESNLIELTDPSILSQISSFLPFFINESASILNKSNLSVNGLYEVILPSDAILANSKDMVGASRGFFRGADGISGHANLVPVKLGSNVGVVMGTVASVMNIASILVGQYYMSEINSRLKIVENEIKSVSSFQKSEFESRVITSITYVVEMLRYSDEIVKSDEVRIGKLNTTESLKREMAQLIEQLLLQIKEDLVTLNKKKIKEYEDKSKNLDRQIKLLIGLVISLQELSNIELLLGKGKRSKELVFSLYQTEEEKVLSLFDNIEKWHDSHRVLYDIDLKNNRRRKTGFRKTVGAIQSIHDENKKYDYLDTDLSEILHRHLDLSLEEPVMIEKPDKFRIIYNGEDSKSYISIG
ncbi:hypothetical protein [Carnobacterium maltaromaticum]|uniref:hypothetical protein n=1 Tax=Carnobacterium maltaromaticum TaxID=2751 RepID=UPI00295EBF7A|nr:hypothetical protein [Carnobacterium maltaromaticum]